MNSNDNQLNMSIPLLTGVIKKLTSNGNEGSPLETISSHPIEEKLIAYLKYHNKRRMEVPV